MSDALYEQYKDALRRGHLAALHGELEAALAAYEEAASVAPDRAVPHTSRGTVLARLGRPDEALAAFDAALLRSPRDETALAGRAETLAGLERRVEAAAAFDRLAAAAEASGRLVVALDAARRALESAESRGRRELVRDLSSRIAASPPDEAAGAALDRALGVLESDPRGRIPAAPEVPGAGAAPGMAEEDLAALAAAADDAIAADDRPVARDSLLRLARAHRRQGHVNAALDACYLALSVAPDDPGLHLELVSLYDERGWTGAADEKLRLLRRLVDLDGDAAIADRVATVAAGRGRARETGHEVDAPGTTGAGA